MPYEAEYAHYRPLHRIVGSARVRELLARCRVRDTDVTGAIALPDGIAEAPTTTWRPRYVLAVDGSYAAVPVRNGFPGAEAAYVTVASVFLNFAKLRELDRSRPVDPKDFRTTQEAECIDCAMPGCNVVIEGEESAHTSLRKAIFEVFKSVRVSEDGESFLDTYESLLEYKPAGSTPQKCPYEGCVEPYALGKGEYTCPCEDKRVLYSTDALRIHEGMRAVGSNGAMFAEVMQVLERLWIIHVLRTLEQKGWLSTLRRVAIVLDGPLAVFGHPAWLSQVIYREVARINTEVKKATGGQDLLLLGVEKSGAFVDHFTHLDESGGGGTGNFPSRAVLLLSDSYIRQNIVFSASADPKPYGEASYFSRKLLYKTSSGALLVATLPFLSDDHRDITRAEPSQYPRLVDALALLDDLVSSRYPNAFSPLVSAHAEAAIPLSLGKKVLERLARELMEEEDR